MKNEQIEQYKQATWDFIMEHCELLPSGALFVKFHTSGQFDFEKRVNARLRGYHREDVDTKKTTQEVKREEFITKKKRKKEIWLADREERRKKMKWLKLRNRVSAFISRIK